MAVVEGEALADADPDVGAQHSRAAGGDERLRRIDGGDMLSADHVGECAGQRTRAAADVKCSLPAPQRGDLDQLGCELRAVAATWRS